MLELAQSLILNEDALNSLSEKKRSVFIYEWLCFLNKVLSAAQKDDIRECQSQIIEQLLRQIQNESKPPIRTLIGQNLAKLFTIADQSSLLIKTINRCIDILRTNNEVAHLTIVVIIGALYERLGRFLHRSCEETVQLLLKILKNGASQKRYEVLLTLEHIINGLGPAGRILHREIHKIAKTHLSDRTMSVRSAAAMCLIALINQNSFMYTNELEGNITIGLRAFENSNYEVRCSVAKYLAILLAAAQDILSDRNQNLMNKSNTSNTNKIKVEEILNYLSESFIRGNLNSFKFNITDQSKGPTTVRIGVTYTYVELIRILGTAWIEQNLSLLINHLLEIVGNLRVSTSHIDTIFSRKCITFILRSVISLHHGENAQFIVVKELIIIITRYINLPPMVNSSTLLTNDSNISSLNSSMNSMIRSYGSTAIQLESSDIECRHNVLICALYELNSLIQSLGTSTFLLLHDSCSNLIDTLFLVILNPSQPVRLTAAWCFRSIAIVLPSLMTPLIDQCLEKMNDLAKQLNSFNIDAMSGLSFALQALLGAVHQCPLGIPSQRVKKIFDFADNLLRTTIASTVGQEQSFIPRLILQRTSTAWHCLSACCTLDQSLVKKFIRRFVLLWRNVFPRSPTDFEQEKQRGDSLTWILSFNQRSGALCSMISFLNNCSIADKNLLSNDLLKCMVNAITILFYTPNLIRQFGHQLKISITIFRLRLYELLLRVPSQFYEQHFKNLLRELMAEFTLADSSLHTTTSLLRSICHDKNHDLLGIWPQETQEQLHPHSTTGFGAFEHDETYLYRRDTSLTSFNLANYLFSSSSNDNSSNMNCSSPTELNIPEPLPLNIAVIDASIRLYSRIFTRISNKHRLKLFQHFIDLIKQSKDARQEAIQINILTAIVLSLKTLAETKQVSPLNDDILNKCACTLVIQTLNHPNPMLRCAAAEAFGCLVEVLPDKRLTENIIQFCFDHLKESRDIPSRTGYSLALACSYRYLDDITKEKYLSLSIPVLHTIIEDQSTTIVQVWALHALTLIADSTGHMIQSYIEPLLEFIVHLLLSTVSSQIGISQCCSRLLSTLIINMGPDLQINTNSSSVLCSLCLTAISLLQMHIEPVVQAETLQAWQQLYLCTPRHVHLSILVPELIQGLTSRELLLRRACISCLKQLSQREAKEIEKHAKLLFIHDSEQDSSFELSRFRSLEEFLFSILDSETDTKIYLDIQDVLVHMLQTLGLNHLTQWLQLCHDILATTTDIETDDHQRTTLSKSSSNSVINSDDDEQLPAITEQNLTYHSTSSMKWQTKIFAINCMQKLINYCEQTTRFNLHFNYDSAKEHLCTYPHEDYLVLHLHILIKSTFLACKSTHDPLRLSGLSLLKQIILKFAYIEKDMDLSDHIILKQYQSQIDAAIRPAFSRRTSSHVTIQACDVCRIWISSKVSSDLHDLRRIHQLLISSLQKFTSIQQQYASEINMISNESALTSENLAILKLWADVYNFAVGQVNGNLLLLIQTELYILVHHWLAMLTDYAFLMLPKEFNGMNSSDGNFYLIESNIDLTRRIYKATWSSIMQAATQWLVEHHYQFETSSTNHKLVNYRQRDSLMTKLLTSTLVNQTRRFPEKKEDLFAMLLACCVDALSISISEQTDETIERILVSLINLLRSDIAVSQITIELITVLHRLCSIRTDIKTHLEILKILKLIFSTHIQSESFLFTSLTLIVSILLNYFPNINNDSQLYSIPPMKIDYNSTKHLQIIELITSIIQLFQEFINLCVTNQNIQKFVPVFLHLLLSISFVLFSTKFDQQKSLLSQIFPLIENLCKTSINKTISYGAMNTMMNLRANLIENNLSDNGYFVRCLTSLILNSDSINLSKQIIDFYQKTFDDQDIETHLQIVECLNELFQLKNLSRRNTFIRIFTPLLLIELKQTDDQQQIIRILKIFEKLLSIVDSTLRLRLASLIIPLFIHYLPDSTSSNVKINEHLSSYVIERLQYLLNEFHFILQASPDLQSRLENAIHRHQ